MLVIDGPEHRTLRSLWDNMVLYISMNNGGHWNIILLKKHLYKS